MNNYNMFFFNFNILKKFRIRRKIRKVFAQKRQEKFTIPNL